MTSSVLDITVADFGILKDGTKINEFTLRNTSGTEVKIINYGGIITSLKTKDKLGNLDNIVLGLRDLDAYVNDASYLGALIGRVANRIAKGRFQIDDISYSLETNNGCNHLHGGSEGFHKKAWAAKPFATNSCVGLELTLLSEDGDQGYPGNLAVTVTYILTNDNELVTEYYATTDKVTPLNMTQHSYFNLSGSDTVLDHLLYINADYFTPADSTQIPTGEIRPVAKTPFDFRRPVSIGTRIENEDLQLLYAQGYDHNFVLNKNVEKEFHKAAVVEDPVSGRLLEVWTQEPCIQFYSGNSLDGSLSSGSRAYIQHSGFCLEPQHFPDSPNQSTFPSIMLKPGEAYQTRTSFKFLTVNY